MRCPNCGAVVNGNKCEYCDTVMSPEKSNTVINNYYYSEKKSDSGDSGYYSANKVKDNDLFGSEDTYYSGNVSSKSRIIALFLCIFLGCIGAHLFYVGKIGKGLLYLCTGGLLGLGWIWDTIMILIGKFKDRNGLPLVV